jgi:hypothetical protein
MPTHKHYKVYIPVQVHLGDPEIFEPYGIRNVKIYQGDFDNIGHDLAGYLSEKDEHEIMEQIEEQDEMENLKERENNGEVNQTGSGKCKETQSYSH